MALLTTLGLKPSLDVAKALLAHRATDAKPVAGTVSAPPDPGPSPVAAKTYGTAKVDAKASETAKANYDKAWKETLAFAAGLGDNPAKLELASALKACEEKKKAAQAVAASDPAKHAALMQAALAEMQAAREAAKQRSEEIPRALAKKLKAGIEKHFKENHAEYEKQSGRLEALKRAIAVAKGAHKADLEAKLGPLEKQVEAAEHHRDEAQADLEKLDDPETKREELDAIVARRGKNANVGRQVDVDTHDGDKHLPGEKHVTTTTTSVENGTAKVDKTEVERKIGPGSVTQKTSRETERTTADQSVRRSTESETKVSLKGVSRETSDKIEIERGGKTVSVEEKHSLEVGKEGVTGSKTRTITGSDGSSVSTKTSSGLVRGEGQVGASASTEKTRTDKSGNESSKGLSSKTAVLAGEDGYGLGSQATGSIGSARKSGFNTKAALGLSGNITCDIGEPKSGLYPVTLKVRFGASVALGSGHDKKGGSAKASVDVEASKEVTMEVTQNLTEKELQHYVDTLKKANTGNKVDATYNELAIISVGASQTWEDAKRMYQGQPILGKKAGDSVKLGDETKIGASAKVALKAVSVEGSYSEGHKHSTKATRNEKGGVDAVGENEDTRTVGGGGGVDTGLTGVTRKAEQVLKTSIGYMVTIDAGADPDGKLLAAFHACKSSSALEQFIAAHKGQVKVTGKKDKRACERADNVGFSVLAVDMDLKYKHGTEQNVTTDEKGNVVDSEVTGTNEVGGSVGVGKGLRFGDSRQDKATSKHDDKGKLELDMKRTKSETSIVKTLKNLVGMGDDEQQGEGEAAKRKKGLIATAAGGEEKDNQVHDVAGVRLVKADIEKIVQIAKGDVNRWTDCAARNYDRKTYDQWRELGAQIAAEGKDPAWVADQLALYVGKDQGKRMNVLMQLVRPSGSAAIGKRTEFPESLKKCVEPYEELVIRDCVAEVEDKAKEEGPEAAGKLGQELFQRLAALLVSVSTATDFRHDASQAEMVRAIDARKHELLAVMRKNAGKTSDKDEDDALRHDYNRVVLELQRYAPQEAPHISHLEKMLGKYDYFLSGDLTAVLAEFDQLADLYAIWNQSFDQAVEIGKKIGRADHLPCKPDLARYKKLRRANRQSD
ncbi:MAG: hypothetical protein ABI460_11950 [Caldimonas sp.]